MAKNTWSSVIYSHVSYAVQHSHMSHVYMYIDFQINLSKVSNVCEGRKEWTCIHIYHNLNFIPSKRWSSNLSSSKEKIYICYPVVLSRCSRNFFVVNYNFFCSIVWTVVGAKNAAVLFCDLSSSHLYENVTIIGLSFKHGHVKMYNLAVVFCYHQYQVTGCCAKYDGWFAW